MTSKNVKPQLNARSLNYCKESIMVSLIYRKIKNTPRFLCFYAYNALQFETFTENNCFDPH